MTDFKFGDKGFAWRENEIPKEAIFIRQVNHSFMCAIKTFDGGICDLFDYFSFEKPKKIKYFKVGDIVKNPARNKFYIITKIIDNHPSPIKTIHLKNSNHSHYFSYKSIIHASQNEIIELENREIKVGFLYKYWNNKRDLIELIAFWDDHGFIAMFNVNTFEVECFEPAKLIHTNTKIRIVPEIIREKQ